jgi:hypothetical protein
LYGALVAVSERAVVPFWTKHKKDVECIIQIEVSRSRNKFMDFDGLCWWFWRLVYLPLWTFQWLQYCSVRYLRLSEHPLWDSLSKSSFRTDMWALQKWLK